MTETRSALITGCGSGIGRHLTTVLSKSGYQILATDVNYEALEKNKREIKWNSDNVKLMKLDVRDAEEWQNAIEYVVKTWGKLDVCMNIAGYCIPGFAYEFSLEQVDLHFDINTKGAILGTRLAAQQMLKQGFGHIINMCSLAGLAPAPGISLYSASKFALRGFSLAAYYELKPKGIDISIVEPDLVDTGKLQTQLLYQEEAAAIGFSAPRILKEKDIEKIFLTRVLRDKVLEISIPLYRGWLCKFAGTFPKLSEKMFKSMAKAGMNNIAREKKKRVGFENAMTPDKWIYEQELSKKKKV